MAELIRTKQSGEQVTISQYCNDWFSVILSDGRTKIVSPTSLQLDEYERVEVFNAMHDGKTGMMLIEFDLDLETGRFRRKSMR